MMRRTASSGSARRDLWLTELDQALQGAASGPAAESWRELRADVRSLAPPMAPGFADRLEQNLTAGRSARGRAGAGAPGPTSDSRRRRRTFGGIPGRLRARSRSFGGLRLGASAAAILAVIAALLVIGPWRSAPVSRPGAAVTHGAVTGRGASPLRRPEAAGPRAAAPEEAAPAEEAEIPAATAAPRMPPVSRAAPGTFGSAASGRLQQLRAAIGLTTTPGQVQGLSDRVERLGTSEGGYVESSEVQTQGSGSSEAAIVLRVPSTRLAATMAALERLGKVSSESQSSQDITGSYNATRARLRDAQAEHRALLHALAAATGEREISSLQRRLARSRRAIEWASAKVQAISRQGSRATIEVSVTGIKHKHAAGSTHGKSLTLGRGAREALHVLTVVLVVLLVAAAILLPVALLLGILLAAYGAWRRNRRERVLDAA